MKTEKAIASGLSKRRIYDQTNIKISLGVIVITVIKVEDCFLMCNSYGLLFFYVHQQSWDSPPYLFPAEVCRQMKTLIEKTFEKGSKDRRKIIGRMQLGVLDSTLLCPSHLLCMTCNVVTFKIEHCYPT